MFRRIYAYLRYIATSVWIHVCCQISFPIGKEMFYFDSSNAIRKTIRKQKTFILLRRIPLCDTFGCYCKTEIYIWNIWRKHFCKTLPFHLLVADCSIFTLSSLVAIAVHFLVRTPQIMNFANIWRKGHFLLLLLSLQNETVTDWLTHWLTGIGARRCYRI